MQWGSVPGMSPWPPSRVLCVDLVGPFRLGSLCRILERVSCKGWFVLRKFTKANPQSSESQVTTHNQCFTQNTSLRWELQLQNVISFTAIRP